MRKIKKPLGGRAKLIDGGCVACGELCKNICPVDAIQMSKKGTPIINDLKCIGCVKCIKVCPVNALFLYFTEPELIQLNRWKEHKYEIG